MVLREVMQGRLSRLGSGCRLELWNVVHLNSIAPVVRAMHQWLQCCQKAWHTWETIAASPPAGPARLVAGKVRCLLDRWKAALQMDRTHVEASPPTNNGMKAATLNILDLCTEP